MEKRANAIVNIAYHIPKTTQRKTAAVFQTGNN